jgi:hypothetical protein
VSSRGSFAPRQYTRRRRAALALLTAALLCGAAAARGHAQRPPPGSPGATTSGARLALPAISGTVVNAVTGAPVAGALVALNAGGAGQQIADDVGRFLFTNLSSPLSFTVRATKPGYFDGALGKDTWQSPPQALLVTKPEWISDVQIRLFPHGALSGVIRGAAGEPLARVHVAALTHLEIAGTTRLVTGPTALTDDDGRYRIAPLPPGSYVVMVPSVRTFVPPDLPLAERLGLTPLEIRRAGTRSNSLLRPEALASDGMHTGLVPGSPPLLPHRPDARDRGYPATFHPGARARAAARVITLAPGEERSGVDVELEPVPLFRVTGPVNAPPAVVRHLGLRLLPRGMEEMGLGHEAAITVVGADGRFSFPAVPEGEYTLVAARFAAGFVFTPHGASSQVLARLPATSTRVPGYLTRPEDVLLRVDRQSGDAFTGQIAVRVSRSDITGLVVSLQRGASLRGHVVQEGKPLVVSGLASDDRAVEVRAEPADGSPLLSVHYGVARGNASRLPFEIVGVPPGRYLLRAADPGGGILKSVVWNGEDFTEVPFTVAPGLDVRELILTVTTLRSIVQGSVRDANGRLVRAGTVICFPANPSRWQQNGLRPTGFESAEIGTNGQYRLFSVPAGDHYLVAIGESLGSDWESPAFLAGAGTHATRISVDWGGTRTQHLTLSSLQR